MALLSHWLVGNKRFDFSSKAFGDGKFVVVNMEGFEAISQPFRFTLTLMSDDAGIDFDEMLQNPATFNIYAPDGASHTPYHGVLAEFEQLHRADSYVFYRAVLVPRLWRLSLYRISEVYLNEQAIPATLEKVLKNGRLTSSDYELKLTGSYRPRSFVCQYQEAHLDFLSRWMEKEGMYYYFDHSGDADKLIVADSRTMHDAQATRVSYRPDDELDTGTAPDVVRDFVCRQKPLPHQVILQDFNHRKASVQLKVQAVVSESGIGDVMLYGENFRDEAEGNRYAKLRAEEIVCGGKVFSGEGTAVGLRTGYFLELAHHYRDDFNGKYLVTEIHHQGSQAVPLLNGIKSPFTDGAQGGETSYRNSFRAIPAAVQFRAERVTAKPRVAGTMSATIDSEGSGEYAELDAYGQYKVQLPFDQTDKDANKGSARVRMATPYSGSDHGMHFPLHKNAEVLLSFIDGDPDQPMIIGAVPNSENRSVVNQDNAHENRISTAGGNQMFMGDSKGREVMWLHSPFHNSTIGIGSTDPEGGGSLWTSTGGSSESVTVGTSNSIFGGVKNSLSVSFENTLAASVSNKMTMGTSLGFSLGADIAWKKGRSYTVDDADSIALKTTAKMLANDSVTISGGQRAPIKALIESLKTKVQVAVGLNLAVNAAIAAAAARMIDEFANVDDKGKVAPWEPAGWGVTAVQAEIGALLVAMPTHQLLYYATEAIAEAAKKTEGYASNIKVDGSGIDIRVDNALIDAGRVQLEKTKVSVTANSMAGEGSIIVQPDSIALLSNGGNPLSSGLNLSPTEAKLSTDNPAGKVVLEHPVGGTVTLDNSEIGLKCGTARLDLYLSDGVGMECVANSVSVTGTEVNAQCGVSGLNLSAGGAELKSGSTVLKIMPASATISCPLIQLG